MDEAAEDVAPTNGAGADGVGRWSWRHQLQSAMGPRPVVVVDVLDEDRFEVTPREHEQVVVTIPPLAGHLE